MTTLDDAAERIDAISDQCTDGVIGTREAVEAAWREATEAAAKKCDDLADGNASSMAYVCAAAIRR